MKPDLTGDTWALNTRIAAAVNAVLKEYPGFRGKFTINCVAPEGVRLHDISVEFRYPQPKGSHS